MFLIVQLALRKGGAQGLCEGMGEGDFCFLVSAVNTEVCVCALPAAPCSLCARDAPSFGTISESKYCNNSRASLPPP